MVEQQSPGDFQELTRKISAERGFGCASYKEKCLRRRIAVRMRARGVHTYTDYARILDDDAGEYERLLDALTINVTKLFRNWDVYASIAANVVPDVWRREQDTIRVWSAGCSSGDEPYSLAILFHRYAAANGVLPRLSRVEILGTDIDRQCLAAAERGQFGEGDFADTPDDLRTRYFTADTPFTVIPAIRGMVRFERRDLLSDSAPPGKFDVVVCRNVMIYFDRETQERLFDKFHAALAPGGFLVLGKVETLLGAARSRFTAVDARERIFRRL
ncbi:MAG TPA: protein-glutamate O-methyltransferase CheR [Gemmatimonadaceae bacterium]|jgi:chemotaxis methyl-accepting protein methylase|nr:protein-glutamate O-methyltransferase CheR [Gemmatimonadaceae bacterium]